MENQDYELFVYEPEKWLRAVEKRYLIDEPANVKEYDNAIVLPLRYKPETVKLYGDGLLEGGLCSSNFEFLAGLKRSRGVKDVNRNCSFAYRVEKSEIEYCDESVIFGGLVMSHFGHMLCDGTTRLWYMADNPADIRKVVFVVYPNQVFPYWDLLEMAGIPRERVVIVDHPVQFAHVVVPDETSYSIGEAGYKQEWTHVLDRIRGSVEPSRYKKVYYTRTRLENSGCVGEQFFADLFARNGYHVVSPETLSFRDQVALVAGADELAATMGTIANQIMFAQPGTHLTVLNRSETVVEGVPLSVQAASARASYIDAFANLLPETQGGFCIHLMADNVHWRGFLRDHPEFDGDAIGEYPAAEYVVQYLHEWAKRYEKPQYYRWIRNETVPDVIRRLNRYLRNVPVDPSQYSKSALVDNLEYRCKAAEEQLLCARASVPEFAFASAYVTDGLLAIEGSLPTFLAPPQSCNCVLDVRVSGGMGIKGVSPLQVAFESSDCLGWRQVFEIPEDLVEGSSITAALRISTGREVVLPVRAVCTADANSIAVLRSNTVLVIPQTAREDVVARVVHPETVVPDQIDYEITSMEWEGHTLIMSGLLVNPLADVEGGACRPVLVDDAGRVILSPEFGVEPGAGQSKWECSVCLDDIVDSMVCNDLPRLGWRWSLSIAGYVKQLPFGRRRFVGSIKKYRSQCSFNHGKLLLPVEFGQKNLGFRCTALSDVSLVPRIEEAKLDKETLNLAGLIDNAASLLDIAELSVAVCRQDDIVPMPTVMRVDTGTSTVKWDAEIDLAEVASNGAGRWTLALTIVVGKDTGAIAFGEKRPEGTLAKIGNGCIDNKGRRVSIVENRNKKLVFEVAEEALELKPSHRRLGLLKRVR